MTLALVIAAMIVKFVLATFVTSFLEVLKLVLSVKIEPYDCLSHRSDGVEFTK